MQFIDLEIKQARIRTSIDARIKKVLDHGNILWDRKSRNLKNFSVHLREPDTALPMPPARMPCSCRSWLGA